MGRLSKLISRFAVGIVFVSLLSSAFIGLEPQKAKADGPPSCSGTPPAGAGGQPATIQLTSLTDSSEGIKVNILFSHLYVVSQNSINHAVINIYRGTESGGTVNWDKRYNIESNNLDITNQIKTTPAGSTGPYTTQGYYYDKTGLTKGSVYHYMVIGKAPTGGNGSNDGCVISGEQNITYQGSGIEPPSPVPCPTGVKLAGDSLVAPTSGANPKTVTLAWSMSSEPSGVKYKIVNGSGGTENIKGADGQAGDSVSTKQATIQRLVSPTGEVTVLYTVIAFTPDGKESTGCKAISIKYGADGVIAFTDQSGAVTSIGYSAYTNKAQTIGRCGKGPNMNDGITGGIMETMKYAFCVVVDWIYQLSVKFLYGAVGLLSETSGIASSIGKAEDREKTTFFSGVIPCELKSVNLANKLIAAASINAPSGACTSGGAIGKVVVNAHTMVLGMVNFLVLIIFIVIALANVLQIQMQNYQIKKLLPGLLVGFVIANFSLFFIRASLEVQGQLTDSIFKIKYSDVITGNETSANYKDTGITTTTNDSVRSSAPTIDYKDIVDATKENGINEAKLREKMAAAAAEEAKYCKKTYDLSCFVSSVAAVGGNAAMPMFKVVKGDKGTFLSALTNTVALAGIPAVGPSMAIYNMYSYFTSDNIYTVVIFDLVVQQAILNVFVIAAAVMIFVLGFLFMLRPIVFYFLTPLAPLGMLLMFIPQFKSTGDKWWKTFVGWLFMPTVSVFWLWLGFMWVRALADVQAAAYSSATSVYLPPITAFFTYAFALFCIYMAMKTPFSMAGEAKDLVTKWNALGKNTVQGKNAAGSAIYRYTPVGAMARGYNQWKDASKAGRENILKGPAVKNATARALGGNTINRFLARRKSRADQESGIAEGLGKTASAQAKRQLTEGMVVSAARGFGEALRNTNNPNLQRMGTGLIDRGQALKDSYRRRENWVNRIPVIGGGLVKLASYSRRDDFVRDLGVDADYYTNQAEVMASKAFTTANGDQDLALRRGERAALRTGFKLDAEMKMKEQEKAAAIGGLHRVAERYGGIGPDGNPVDSLPKDSYDESLFKGYRSALRFHMKGDVKLEGEKPVHADLSDRDHAALFDPSFNSSVSLEGFLDAQKLSMHEITQKIAEVAHYVGAYEKANSGEDIARALSQLANGMSRELKPDLERLAQYARASNATSTDQVKALRALLNRDLRIGGEETVGMSHVIKFMNELIANPQKIFSSQAKARPAVQNPVDAPNQTTP